MVEGGLITTQIQCSFTNDLINLLLLDCEGLDHIQVPLFDELEQRNVTFSLMDKPIDNVFHFYDLVAVLMFLPALAILTAHQS